MNDNGTQPQDSQYLIIGAGPAGLQLGYFMEKAGRDYLILEAGQSAGTFFKRFPRHRQMISNNKVYTGYTDPEINLRFDWNSLLGDTDEMLFKHYSESYFPKADDMVRYLEDYAKHYELKIRYGVKVKRISCSEGGGFVVESEGGQRYRCERLIVATGFTKAYVPEIEGIELGENYTEMSVDPAEYRNQRVLILGKGNSAFESADNLIESAAVIHVAGPSPLKVAWKTHFVGHLRAVNNNLLDTYLLKSQNGVLDASIDRIERQDGHYLVSFSYQQAHGSKTKIAYDRVLICTGWQFDTSIFDADCRPALTLNDRFPAQTSQWESTNIKDLYFAGTLMQMRDFKKTTSGFIHGFRYNVQALHRIFEQKYHNLEWPHRQIDPLPEALVGVVIKRLNTSSALWQQVGFLCDVIIVPGQGEDARYYEDVPTDYVHSSALGKEEHYYLVTFEYGPDYMEYPFNFNRYVEPSQAHLNPQLHPVIRRYEGSKLISEQHILDELEAQWTVATHGSHLLSFFQRQFSAPLESGNERPTFEGEVQPR